MRFCSRLCHRTFQKRVARETRDAIKQPDDVPGARWITVAAGYFALVDDDDFDRLNENFWLMNKGYAHVNSGGPPMHYQIIPRAAGLLVDHVNGNKLDNRKANLRYASKRQNAWNGNAKPSIDGYKGVERKHQGPGQRVTWSARIRTESGRLYLGAFGTPEDAARAYDHAARKYHGEHGTYNFPCAGERQAERIFKDGDAN